MRQIILLRHAHAHAAGAGQSDRDRSLSAIGKAEAAAAGRWLAEHGGEADVVLCSPAARTVETLAIVNRDWSTPAPTIRPEIYDASPGDLIRLLDGFADTARVLLVGHNPGLEELVALLAEGRTGDRRGLPPGAVAIIELAPDAALEPAVGRVSAFWSP
ncbi:MAG: histidine phosphatase family protein [Xanthomonadaceae bacterium]|nr:histidine phosphatase family protein [Xanthomonadaceae bacterium]